MLYSIPSSSTYLVAHLVRLEAVRCAVDILRGCSIQISLLRYHFLFGLLPLAGCGRGSGSGCGWSSTGRGLLCCRRLHFVLVLARTAVCHLRLVGRRFDDGLRRLRLLRGRRRRL